MEKRPPDLYWLIKNARSYIVQNLSLRTSNWKPDVYDIAYLGSIATYCEISVSSSTQKEKDTVPDAQRTESESDSGSTPFEESSITILKSGMVYASCDVCWTFSSLIPTVSSMQLSQYLSEKRFTFKVYFSSSNSNNEPYLCLQETVDLNRLVGPLNISKEMFQFPTTFSFINIDDDIYVTEAGYQTLQTSLRQRQQQHRNLIRSKDESDDTLAFLLIEDDFDREKYLELLKLSNTLTTSLPNDGNSSLANKAMPPQPPLEEIPDDLSITEYIEIEEQRLEEVANDVQNLKENLDSSLALVNDTSGSRSPTLSPSSSSNSNISNSNGNSNRSRSSSSNSNHSSNSNCSSKHNNSLVHGLGHHLRQEALKSQKIVELEELRKELALWEGRFNEEEDAELEDINVLDEITSHGIKDVLVRHDMQKVTLTTKHAELMTIQRKTQSSQFLLEAVQLKLLLGLIAVYPIERTGSSSSGGGSSSSGGSSGVSSDMSALSLAALGSNGVGSSNGTTNGSSSSSSNSNSSNSNNINTNNSSNTNTNIYRDSNTGTGTYTIRGIELPPDSLLSRQGDDDTVACALSYVVHLMLLITKYLGLSLRYQLLFMGSRSMIRDSVYATLGNTPFASQGALQGGAGLVTSTMATLPLFRRNVEKERFEKALSWLKRDVEQILMARGIRYEAQQDLLGNLRRFFTIEAAAYTDLAL